MKNRKHYTKKDDLQRLLNQKANVLYEEAIRNGGKIEAEQLDDLDQMERLIKVHGASSKPTPNTRWLFAVIFLATLVFISALLFIRVSKTDIELNILVSEMKFKLQKRQFLTNLMQLSVLGVSGIREINIPRSEGKEANKSNSSDDSGFSLQLSEADSLKKEGTLTLGAISLPANSFVSLKTNENSSRFEMTLQDSELLLRANVNGKILMGTSTTPSERLHFLSPRAIDIRAGSDDVDLAIKLNNVNGNFFAKRLLADSLSFTSIEEHNEDEHPLVRNLSSLISGTMFFESLGGQKYQFREGEDIRFGWSSGEIRSISLKDNHIAIAFHGTVSGMTTGSGSNAKSLMPTYLEWLKERHGFGLLWGSTLYIFSLFFTLFKWWRAPL